MADNAGHLHQPEYLRGLARRLRTEADRAEARAQRLESGVERAQCRPECWNVLSTYVYVSPT